MTPELQEYIERLCVAFERIAKALEKRLEPMARAAPGPRKYLTQEPTDGITAEASGIRRPRQSGRS